MTEQTMRFRLGVLVLTALVLLGVLITLFGSMPALFKRQQRFSVTFSDAPGIVPGTPVRRSGVRIGEVESIDLDSTTGQVHVRLLIQRRYSLRHCDQPTLVQGLMPSDISIDLVPTAVQGGVLDVSVVAPGEELVGVRQGNLGSLLSSASEMVPTTQQTLNEVRESIKRFEKLAPLMEETLREYRDVARATREVIPELRHTNQEVCALVKSAHDTMPELRRTNDEVCGLAHAVRESVPSLTHTSDEVGQLAHAVRDTVPELRRTNEEILTTAHNWGHVGEHFDTLLQNNQDKLVKVVDNLNDTLSRLSGVFNDENQHNLSVLLQNVRTSSDTLQSITQNTDEMMKESRQTMHKVGDSVARADEALGNLQQATKPLAERSSNVMKNLDESTEKLNETMSEVQQLLHVIAVEDGTLKRLIVDPNLYNHLDAAACSLDRLLPHLDGILHDLEVFADKLARHPESIGLGGVVRPSSGIK